MIAKKTKPASAAAVRQLVRGRSICAAQPRQIAQLATISGNIAGEENHHCVKLEKKIQTAPKIVSHGLRNPICRRHQPTAKSSPKTLTHQ